MLPVRFPRLLLLPLVLAAAACGGAPGDGAATASSTRPAVSTVPGFIPAEPAPVPGAVLPELQLAADATEIVEGGEIRLDWNSTHASQCQASGSWGGSRPLQGSESLMPSRGDHRYALECMGDGGVARAEILLRVRLLPAPVPEPEAEFSRVQLLEQGCCEAMQ